MSIRALSRWRRLVVAALVCLPGVARAQMSVMEYQPRSTLKVPEHPVTKAKFPFIDVHGHIFRPLPPRHLDSLVREMDQMGLQVMVNLSGSSGDTLVARRQNLAAKPNRFVVFANVDFRGIDDPNWGTNAARQFEEDVRQRGAVGLKVYKNLGMDLVDGSGKRVPVDDPRIDPVWAAAGRLGVPVLIHTAEPVAFFDPVDRYNERWRELTEFPSRARPPSRYPPFDSLLAEQHRVFARHPKTTFIAAHLDWLGNDLDRLGRVFDAYPNVLSELGAVIYELGRQPRRAKAFLTKYQDRILLGKDTYGGPHEYAVYFRVLETEDEYFDYYRPRHAFWKMYGIGLPDEVLKKIYYQNALRVIPGIDRSAFPR